MSGVPVDVFQLPYGRFKHSLLVPSPSGKVEFIIGDMPGCYEDNHGTCEVTVIRV